MSYSGKKSLGMIVAVANTKQIRNNELSDFIQQLDVDLNDMKNQNTKNLVLDKLARKGPLIVTEDKVKQA